MDFYDKVGIVCRRIPEGKVASYGQIALLCGKPQNARQVGYGLRRGLCGEVPAHRVVNGRGQLSGARHFETWDLQKMLLQDEGVEVLWTGDGWRVDLNVYGWKNTLKDALEIQKMFQDGKNQEE